MCDYRQGLKLTVAPSTYTLHPIGMCRYSGIDWDKKVPSPDDAPFALMTSFASASVATTLMISDPVSLSHHFAVVSFKNVSVVSLLTHAVGFIAWIGQPFASFGSFGVMVCWFQKINWWLHYILVTVFFQCHFSPGQSVGSISSLSWSYLLLILMRSLSIAIPHMILFLSSSSNLYRSRSCVIYQLLNAGKLSPASIRNNWRFSHLVRLATSAMLKPISILFCLKIFPITENVGG